jgi:transketolase C-terminal domain/subunit
MDIPLKIDVCYHNLPVVIVGVGANLSYVGLGATHHSFEDIAILRALPNMHVVCPLKQVFDKYDLVCTAEEHPLIGGFGSAVADWLVDNDFSNK